ncbi:outer membrane protein assembly factor BamB family protein [Actinomadura logoneensis]|uniref:outer membrane protein assembly factor BamB family protein n=1 Tax=Actinomadura logoneensis TaxID=2293572 RepID=UPI0013140C2D|nr:PQQ-binding-like beta-propeller repeat protein [Actinomadura logoneensis]
MVRIRQRGVAVATAVVLALAGTVAARYLLTDGLVRHTVTADPVADQPRLGPPPGPLTTAWTRTVPLRRAAVAGHDTVAHEVADGQVVTAAGGGLSVRDARTGALRWEYRRSGWSLLGWTATGGRLVAFLQRDGHPGEHEFLGFDALSGGLLWRGSDGRPATVARGTLHWPSGSDIVLTASLDRRELSGRSAVNGVRRWTLRLPEGCRLYEDAPEPSGASADLAALALDCRGRSHLLAVRPATGALLWDRVLGTDEAPEVAVRGRAVLAADGAALRLYDAEGDQTAVWNDPDACGAGMCPSALSGGLLVLVRAGDAGDGGRTEAVDLRSGRVVWSRATPAYAALTEAGGRLYALRPRLSDGLLPAGVDLISPASGAAVTAPLPFAVDPDLVGVRPWMAAAGGLLYISVPEAAPRPSGAARLVAVRGAPAGRGPAELDGVPPATWPDACELLKPADLVTARLPVRRGAPVRARIASVRLPKPVACEYDLQDVPSPEPSPSTAPKPSAPSTAATPSPVPSGAAGVMPPASDGATVSVRWVAPDAAAAAGLLSSLETTQAQARRRTDLAADDAYELGPSAGTIALRVRRYIVVVDATRPPGAAAHLARAVAQNLRALP